MKTKVLLLALLSGFVFSVSAQEFKPQVGFSTEKVIRQISRKTKLAIIGLFLLPVVQVCYWVTRIIKQILATV